MSAVEESSVYALKYAGTVGQSGFPTRGARHVRSVVLDQTAKAGSASEILKEVLGVDISIPEWALKKLDKIVNGFEGEDISPETLKRLRVELTRHGFSEFYPQALAQLVNHA